MSYQGVTIYRSGLSAREVYDMNDLFRMISASIIALLVTTSCASTPPESTPIEERLAQRGFTIGEEVKRIRDHRINGWNSVDRYTVIMKVGASKNYLVTVRTPCDGLQSAVTLTFSTKIGALTNKDKLVVRGSGGFLEHCYIDTIHTLEKSERRRKD